MNTNEINKQFITNSQLVPWYMAQYRKQVISWITLPLQLQIDYWNSLANAFDPPAYKDKPCVSY